MWPMGLVFLNMEPVLLVLREPIDDKNIHYRAPLMCYEYIYALDFDSSQGLIEKVLNQVLYH